ncbi:acyl-CoA mutase large subunit family protein [Sutcliffiella horikoshii]|uniref:acyl-CoA mutase large subunit family protein n=1 Tax=Sutcliffiella horikoshii TaxID=79883 RepID=UPI003CF9509B
MSEFKYLEDYKIWEKLAEKEVGKFPERKEAFKNSSKISIDRLYPVKLNNNYENIGFPGIYPYTRGIRTSMYRGKFWTMRQYAGFSTAEETNKRFRYLLEQGQTGLSVAFDLPTQLGYDSDDEMAFGEVGKVGVAIDSLEDMEMLFSNIPLDQVSTSMTINAPAAILLAMYVALAEKRGIDPKTLSGTIQNDILKEYIARGTYIFPPEKSLKLTTDIFEYCSEKMPKWNTISISGYHIREAGSNAVQEVAFTFANGIEYIDSAIKKGMKIDEIAPRLSFFFNSHNNFFEEIAKFRAARRIWAKIMKNKYSSENPKSCMLRFHTQTGGSTLTAQQPDNNVVRVTLQALAAVLGGTQSLHTNAKDEALALPTEESAQIALRTQQILAYETGITDTVDPLGGSYFIEQLTDQIEEKVFEYLMKIEEYGGAVQAISDGFIQREIRKEAYEYQKKIESGENVIVGLNKFEALNDHNPQVQKLDVQLLEKQKEKLKRLKQNRDVNLVNHKLNFLKNAANSDENLIPLIIDCVKAYCTVGEICNVLRDVFGEYRGEVL